MREFLAKWDDPHNDVLAFNLGNYWLFEEIKPKLHNNSGQNIPYNRI